MTRVLWRILAPILAALVVLLPGCFAPRYLGLDEPYGDNPYLSAYSVCYDAAVVAHGYPLPLIVGFGLKPGSPGYEIITTTTMPIAALVAAIGGTLAAPAIALAHLFN